MYTSRAYTYSAELESSLRIFRTELAERTIVWVFYIHTTEIGSLKQAETPISAIIGWDVPEDVPANL